MSSALDSLEEDPKPTKDEDGFELLGHKNAPRYRGLTVDTHKFTNVIEPGRIGHPKDHDIVRRHTDAHQVINNPIIDNRPRINRFQGS